jgi:hypothetical protein
MERYKLCPCMTSFSGSAGNNHRQKTFLFSKCFLKCIQIIIMKNVKLKKTRTLFKTGGRENQLTVFRVILPSFIPIASSSFLTPVVPKQESN